MTVYELEVCVDEQTPADITQEVIRRKMNALNMYTKEQIELVVERYKDVYMLNVCGCDEIFYGNRYKFSTFKVLLSEKYV